jgi:hypothetical protein
MKKMRPSTGLMDRLRDQTGVAMITVLFVGASLTAVGSVAAFLTIAELRSTTDDSRAATALSIAEAGVDRMIETLRRGGGITWGHIRLAGCGDNPPIVKEGSVGPGEFRAELTVYDPDETPDERIPSADNAQEACIGRPLHPRFEQTFIVSSVGTHPTATRVVRQEVRIKSLNLPIGIYAKEAQSGGTANALSISLFVEGDIPRGRGKWEFSGIDPYYTLADFWPGLDANTFAPAALHATGTVNLNTGGGPQYEHTVSPSAPLNCTANGIANGQSQFDESSGGGTIPAGPPCAGQTLPRPPDSFFSLADLNRVISVRNISEQDYLALKEEAQQKGLYCFIPTSGASSCTRLGGVWGFSPPGGNVQDSDVGPVLLENKVFVAYFEFQDTSEALDDNEIKWKSDDVWPCSDDPDLNKFALIVVRQGSVSLEAGMKVNGAILAADGEVRSRGGNIFNGTIIAKSFDNSGNSQFQMNPCWVNNLPGPFLDVTPGRWFEVDR